MFFLQSFRDRLVYIIRFMISELWQMIIWTCSQPENILLKLVAV